MKASPAIPRKLSRVLIGLCCWALLGLAWAPVAPAMDQQGGPSPAGLKVVSIMPKGEVPRLTQVTVRFSKPMRALGNMSQAAAGAPLKLHPRPPGQYRWLDPHTLAYILKKPVIGSTRFTATVPAGVRSLDGSRLAKTVRIQFRTPPVRWLRVSPGKKTRLSPTPQFRLTFNQPVQAKSLRRHLSLTTKGRVLRVNLRRLYGRRAIGRSRLAEVYELVCLTRLPPDARVTLRVRPGVRPAMGSEPSTINYAISYRTYGPLALKNWRMERTPDGRLDPEASLTLHFNNPVSPAEVWKRLSFDPPLKPASKPGGSPSRWVSLDVKFQPRTLYRMSLRPGLKDAYGTTLRQGIILDLPMGDLAPVFSLAADKGVLESGLKAVYPLVLRNVKDVRAALTFLDAETIVPALVAEDDRPWNKPPPWPGKGDPGVSLRRLTFDDPPNQRRVHLLDLPGLLGRSPRGGLILMDLRAMLPDSKGRLKERSRHVFLQVTDLALSLKFGEASSLAWVTSLGSGQPLAGVKLQLRDRANKVLWSGVSGDDGTAVLPSLAELKPAPDPKHSWRGPSVFLIATHGDNLAVLPSTWGEDLIYSLPRGVSAINPGTGRNLVAHAITQLPLYQPGQTVRLVVYLRRDSKTGLQAPAGQKVKLLVLDPAGREMRTMDGVTDAYGALGGQVKLGRSARLGTYRVKVMVDKKELYAGSFRVASFRAPDFKLRMQTPSRQVGTKTRLQAKVEAFYHFGTPLAGVTAILKASQEPTDFSPKRLEDYAVGFEPLPGREPKLERDLGASRAKLNSAGRATLAVPRPQTLPGRPVRLLVETEVTDASQRQVTSRRRILIHPAAVYLGLKSSYLATVGKATQLELAAATYDNRPVSRLPVKITVYRQVWETVREKGPGGFYRNVTRARRIKMWSGAATAGPEPVKVNFTPTEVGTLVAVAEASDAAGRKTRTSMYFYATGRTTAGWERHDDHSLELVMDQGELTPGQSARIMIKSPFKTATVLVTVERAGVRRVLVRRVSGPTPVIQVPVRASDAPVAYAGVLLVRGRSAGPPIQGPDLGKPQVRIGYAVLKVKDPTAGLKVQVTTDRSKVKPGERITATVAVTDAGGSPLKAQVLLLAVDERVLTAAGDRTNYDPRQTFGQAQPLAVLTADMRTQVLGRRFQGKKGDDSAGGGAPAAPALRRRFHPAVFWLARAQTDQQGRLSATFTLPDTLTAYRVVAVAADQGRNFGMGQAKVIASLPLQILSALPRFAVAGDEFIARVLVQNLSGQPGQAFVRAQAQGMTLTGAVEKKVIILPGQTKPVGFAVAVGRGKRASITVTARLGPYADKARFSLPIVPLTQLTFAAAAGGLNPAAGRNQAVVPLKLPADAAKGRGGLQVVVSPSLASALKSPAAVVLAYPWDCLEQRTSKAAVRGLKLVYGQRLGLKPAAGDKAALAEALNLVGDFQTGGGGLTLWPGVGRPSLFVTAYVLLVNQEIKGSGVQLPPRVRRRAVEYLERRLRHAKPPKPGQLWARVAEATAVLALAREGRKARAALESAAGRSRGLSPFGLGALIEAAHLLKMPGLVKKLVRELEATAEVSATEMHFTTVHPGWLKPVMGSSLRGNAMALLALSRAVPDYPHLDALARWVAARLGERRYLSTQEGVFGLWGLAAYIGSAGDTTDLTMTVAVAGRQLLSHKYDKPTAAPVTVGVQRNLLTPGKQVTVDITAQGRGRPHWTARLSYAPTRPSDQPQVAGFSLSRTYRVKGDPKADRPTLGQRVEVTLTLRVSATRHHVLVHDPFPAGLEPPEPAAGPPSGGRRAAYVWRWRELRRDRLLLYARRLNPGVYTFTYTLRAVAPGNFRMKRARAEEMYAPEVFGLSAGGYVQVKKK